MTKILPQIRLYFSYLMLALAFAFTAMESPIGIAEEASAPAATPEQASPAQAQKININTADAKTLAENMKGIGIKKAQAIIEYREAFGPFLTVEDLASVKGIGEKTIAKNVAILSVE